MALQDGNHKKPFYKKKPQMPNIAGGLGSMQIKVQLKILSNSFGQSPQAVIEHSTISTHKKNENY